MKFVDRKKELEILKENRKISQKYLRNVVIYGIRRIGKTRLLKEFLKSSDLYFFVPQFVEPRTLINDFVSELKVKKIINEYEMIDNWNDFFKILFERFNGTVAIDEFQNFLQVSPEFFSYMQRYIDENPNKRIMFIVSGSVISLMKKLFSDQKIPLYGRFHSKIELNQIPFVEAYEFKEELKLKFEDFIILYMIFGGIPYYWSLIESSLLQNKSYKEILKKLFFSHDAILEEEVETILSIELGKRKSRFYEILSAISLGNNTLSKIASYMSLKETHITRYIKELKDILNIIEYKHQMFGNKRILIIKHPLIRFWFRFFYRNLLRYKIRNPQFEEYFWKNLNQYLGLQFEEICKSSLHLFYSYTSIGKHWGKGDGKVYEIDLTAVNEHKNEILFVECKWKENVNAKKILKELKEKAKYVNWNNNERKEKYAIFAKSFKTKTDEAMCISLDDLKEKIKERLNIH